jgi:hypothetical protein
VLACGDANRVHCEDVTASADALTQRWLAAYRDHAAPHRRELGARQHDALVNELARLSAGYRAGTITRLLLAARISD